MCIFGELFGGVYPHAEVEDRGHQPIQKGVYYTPDIDFCAFDVQLVCGAAEGSCRPSSWLNYRAAMALFAECGLFYARPLVEGTLAECFAFDIRINSTIPQLLGLPPLEQNQMEGIVIKAVETVHFPVTKILPRAIFKKKNAKFAEVNPKCETTWEAKRRVKKEALDTIYEEIERYINVNRLHNLESKVGPVTRANASEAATALADDALQDLTKDYEEAWYLIEEHLREVVWKNVRSKAAQWLSEHFVATEAH